jgi:phosphoribosyl 1,2-cyclic phosphodiesterase
MSLFIASINSGSNGNCYYIGNDNEAVLVDAGISCRETVKRMRSIGLSINKVKAIFISHEHSDHIYGLKVLSERYNIPVYITRATLQNSGLKLKPELVRSFTAYQQVYIGMLSVHPFPKSHDAADPHSFLIEGRNVKVGVFTDIGAPCQHVIEHFKQCNAAFIETNYDEGMLEQGKYPLHLKRRIAGDKGHLSNEQALELFTAYKPVFMSHVFLSHLSRDNNDPDIVLDLFNRNRGNTKIMVASRYSATAVHQIMTDNITNMVDRNVDTAKQMSLF